jgi:hypothetical protein
MAILEFPVGYKMKSCHRETLVVPLGKNAYTVTQHEDLKSAGVAQQPVVNF